MKNEPRAGAIAKCSRGFIGLITSDKPVAAEHPDGNIGIAWTGIHLTRKEGEEEYGAPWSSRDPEVLCYIENVIESFAVLHRIDIELFV